MRAEGRGQGARGRACRGAGAVRAAPPSRGRCASPPLAGLRAARRQASSMRTKHVNVLIALAAVMLFSFSCFCISRMTQTSKLRVASPPPFPPANFGFGPAGLPGRSGRWGERGAT